jgi:hypothetical protein
MLGVLGRFLGSFLDENMSSHHLPVCAELPSHGRVRAIPDARIRTALKRIEEEHTILSSAQAGVANSYL